MWKYWGVGQYWRKAIAGYLEKVCSAKDGAAQALQGRTCRRLSEDNLQWPANAGPPPMFQLSWRSRCQFGCRLSGRLAFRPCIFVRMH